MLKKLDFILNIMMGSFVGVYLGYGIFALWDYKTHYDLYAAYSAPWYLRVLLLGFPIAIILMVLLLIKFGIRKKLKQS